MSYGMELRDPGGALRLSITSRLMRLHSKIGVYGGTTGSVFIPVAGMEPDGTWVVFAVNAYPGFPSGYVQHGEAVAEIRTGGVFLTAVGGNYALATVYRC